MVRAFVVLSIKHKSVKTSKDQSVLYQGKTTIPSNGTLTGLVKGLYTQPVLLMKSAFDSRTQLKKHRRGMSCCRAL